MGSNTKIQWANHRERFEKHFSKGDPAECWEWRGARLKSGYGVMGKPGGGTITAHRVSYILANGDIADELQVDHLCRNRACVNPAHLEAVTNRENTIRGLRGHLPPACARGHAWTPEITGAAANGRRFCLECRRLRDRGRRDAAYWREYRAGKAKRGDNAERSAAS